MHVSFGSMNVNYDINPNARQGRSVEKILRALDPDWIELLRCKEHYKGYNITEQLEKNKLADVYVTLKKNGLIGVVVKNKEFDYVPCSISDDHRLRISIDPELCDYTMEKKIREFADRCLEYAIGKTDSQKNQKLGINAKKRSCKRLANSMDIIY